MLRLELQKGGSTKFWELDFDATHFELRRGKGSRVQVEHKRHASVRAAQADAYNKMAARLSKGYVEVSRSSWRPLDPSADPRWPSDAKLEAPLHELASDCDAWQVYADWLASREAELGERLALELAATEQTSPRLLALRRSQRARWYGPELVRVAERRDFLAMARVELRHGFIVGVELRSAGLDNSTWGGPRVDHVLAALLRAPASRCLRTIQIHLDPDPRETHLRACLHALREYGQLDSLRSLSLNTVQRWAVDEDVGPLDWLFTRAPRLTHLDLAARTLVLHEPLHHPTLEHLRLDAQTLPLASLSAVAGGHLPACKRLEMSTGRYPEAGCSALERLAPLLEGQSYPALQGLVISETTLGDTLVDALLDAPLFAQLRELGLAASTLSDAGLERLLAQPERLAGLRRLRLGGNQLAPLSHGNLARLRVPGLHTDTYHRQRTHRRPDEEARGLPKYWRSAPLPGVPTPT